MNFTEEIKKEARLEGWQKGQKDGWQKRNKEVILKMLQEKAEISFISKVTGLSEREIKKLQNGA